MKLIPYDGADFLESEADMSSYLNAALEENDPQFFMKALGNIAKARGVSSIAQETGLARQQLYKTLSSQGNPRLDTLFKLSKTLGIKLTVETASS